jgi:hypothetical protein
LQGGEYQEGEEEMILDELEQKIQQMLLGHD